MATFKFNDGNPFNIQLSSPLAKVFISANIVIGNAAIKIAGHSAVNLAGKLSIEDVQFDDHALDIGNALTGKKLVVIINVSKLKIQNKELKGADTKVECHLTFKTKTSTIQECVMDDSANPEFNSIFMYVITFSK